MTLVGMGEYFKEHEGNIHWRGESVTRASKRFGLRHTGCLSSPSFAFCPPLPGARVQSIQCLSCCNKLRLLRLDLDLCKFCTA